jgi:hypothetical protein
VYYGSTSLRCLLESTTLADRAQDDSEQLLHTLLSDGHARLRILRLAQREAVVRAGGPLNVLQAEISGRVIRESERVLLAIDVDVSADEMVVNRDAM